MQHSKSTFIDLKLRLVIAFLFISIHAVFSQSSVLIGNAVHQDGKAVSGAYIFINKQDSKILTNNAGCFTLTVNPRDTITIIDAVTNDYYIIPDKHTDTIVYTFILTEKSYTIEEINVSANRLEHISGDFNEYIIDYYVFETGSIALLKSYKNKYYLTFQNASKEKQDFELPFVPKEFYLDCVENMHIVSKDSTYQFWIDTTFLRTLHQDEIRSGIGEILKVHAIESSEEFDRAAESFELMLKDFDVLEQFIHSALFIKKRYIEIDEFDVGIRNIFNLGHSFGHAIEAATMFAVPHGIAVSMGMHIACSVAAGRGLLQASHAERMQGVLSKNFSPYASVQIPIQPMMAALVKDKKNSSIELGLILPIGDRADIKKIMIEPDAQFQQQLADSLSALR